MHAVVIGGTRFVGRHAVGELLDHGYHVTMVNRGNHEDPFVENDRVRHVEGDRNDREVLERARDTAAPDVVVDCVAFAPQQVATATDVFAGAGAYVFVSSIGAYSRLDLPRREDETPLEAFRPEHAVDDPASMEPPDWTSPLDPSDFAGYGPRKAECDRVCFAAAEDGANAMVVRPTFVFGPYDYTRRFDYWIDRVANYDRVLVPGDGSSIVHHVYVGDVASALRVVAERGDPGEAYNVGARRMLTMDRRLETIADAQETDVEPVHASERELARHDLAPTDFPLVRPVPVVVDTAKLSALGWESTPHADALARTVDEHLRSDRTGRHHGPDREAERRAIEGLTT